MSAGITYVRAREREGAEQIIREALDIARLEERGAVSVDVVFRAAVDLLSAGTMLQMQPAALGVDLLKLRG